MGQLDCRYSLLVASDDAPITFGLLTRPEDVADPNFAISNQVPLVETRVENLWLHCFLKRVNTCWLETTRTL